MGRTCTYACIMGPDDHEGRDVEYDANNAPTEQRARLHPGIEMEMRPVFGK